MEILGSEWYKDGGTIMLKTTDGVYYIDRRIHTTTEGKIFSSYPKDDNSNIIENQHEIIGKLIEALEKCTISCEPYVYQWALDLINFLTIVITGLLISVPDDSPILPTDVDEKI